MEIKESKFKWIAGLSNGETIIEGEGIASKVEGELSPWWKLQEYLNKNNLTINSFYLSNKDRHFVLPSSSPKFGGDKPVSYNFFRKFSGDFLGGSDYEHYAVAEATYENFKVQLYVSEADPDKVWVNLVTNTNGK